MLPFSGESAGGLATFAPVRGSDQARAAELNAAFADEECRAIFPARGGSGCIRIVSQLDFDVVRTNPKVFVGFSDNTVLHAAFARETGLVTFHGPHPCDSYGRLEGPTEKTDGLPWLVTVLPVKV